MNENTGTADAINKNELIDSNTTTPTQSKKPIFTPHKYRGHTLEILSVLSECAGMITPEIANKTLLSQSLIRVYCNRGFHSGIILKVGRWGWAISPHGISVLDTTTTTTTTTRNTTATQPQHNRNTTVTQKSRQMNMGDFLKRENITIPGRSVVVVLVDHYERTGEKFRIFQDEYDLADQFDISLAEVRPALALLKEEGCIYIRREALGWKIGLKVAFVERLQYV